MDNAEHGDRASTREERRYLTLLFADFSHSTALSEMMEAEHYGALMAELRAIYQDSIERHGGVVERLQGDGVLASFGYGDGGEDAGRQAVQATLELHERVRAMPVTLPGGFAPSLHSGIHSGLVLVREGGLELGKHELLGPVPNVASRLSSAAGPHEILVSDETLGPARRFFVTSPPKLLEVRGRADPVLVYKVDARASSSEAVRAAYRFGGEFLGRQAELELLERALAAAMAGDKRSVAVVGAAGQGKTRLVEQFLALALQRGCAVLRGYCESSLDAQPFQPFRHMLQALGRENPSPGDIEWSLGRIAREQTLVLFIDDWQWADDASRAMLGSLRAQSNWALLVVLCSRPEEEGAAVLPADEVITLRPLSASEALQLVSARFPTADPFVAQRICEAASGNPLFVEELCHSAARGEAERRPGRQAANAAWLSHLVQSRVQALDAAQREFVQVAAVIGNVVPAWLLEEITGRSIDDAVLRELVLRDFLFTGERAGTLRFKHGITRDIIYESVGLHERRRLHLRIAGALRSRTPGDPGGEGLEALALHYELGDDAPNAAQFAEQAADKALSASALDRARALYRVALAALDRLPQTPEVALRWVAIVQRLGRVCVFDPVRSELALSLRGLELAERHGDARSIARARHWLGYISYAIGDSRAAIRHGEAALAEARAAGDVKLAAHGVAALGEAHCAAANYERALPLLEEAIAVKRQHRSAGRTDAGLAFSLVCRAWVLAERGQFGEAHQCFDEAAACVGGVVHEVGATVQGWRSAVLLWQGRWEEARAAATASRQIAEATHSLAQLAIARAMDAYAQWMLLRRPESMETILEVMEWLKPRESRLYRSFYHGWLADGLVDLGRTAEGRAHAAQAMQRARQSDLLGLPMAYRALARNAAARCPERAPHYLAWAMRAARQRGSAHEVAVTQLCTAQIASAHGPGARALQLLDEAAAAFTRMQMAWHLAQAAALRQQLLAVSSA